MDPEGFQYHGSSTEEGSDADEISALTEPSGLAPNSISDESSALTESTSIVNNPPAEQAVGGDSGNEADIEVYSGSSSESSSGSDDDDDGYTEDPTNRLSHNQATRSGGVDSGRNSDNGPTINELAADLYHGQHDPSRMELTQEEHQWAVAIKTAIEKIPDLDNLSDFGYAQLAIVSHGDVDDAVMKAYRCQEYKEDNEVMDTLDDALRNLPRFDNYLLSFDYDIQSGGYIVAADMTKTDGAIWTNPEDTRYYNRRQFYGSQIAYCDLEALRVGVTILAECEGYRFQLVKGRRMDLTAFRSIWRNAFAYPRKLNQVKFFNAPPVFKMMVSITKAVLPTEITSKFHLVPKCPLGRLDRLYHMPTREIACARLKERMKGLLAKRYTNEANFSLNDNAPFLEEA